jgi:hypothetical protein
MRGEPGFFDVDDRLRRLGDLGDQLEAFGRAVDFEIFRTDLPLGRFIQHSEQERVSNAARSGSWLVSSARRGLAVRPRRSAAAESRLYPVIGSQG